MSSPTERVFDFRDYKIPSDFIRSKSKVNIIMGPVGSGKTAACCLKMMDAARSQTVAPNGIRYYRALVVRNTSPDLQRTVMRDWLELFPPDTPGVTFRNSPPIQWHMKLPSTPTEPGLDFLVDFFSMDEGGSERQVLSYKTSLIYFNEVREFSKRIIDASIDRLGRYVDPYGNGATWAGLIADTNMPDDDHWLAVMEQEERPRGWSFFKQPPAILECKEEDVAGEQVWTSIEPGWDAQTSNFDEVQKAVGSWWMVNPKGDNLKNLPPFGKPPGALHYSGYYLGNVAGKDRQHIRMYYQSKYGSIHNGAAVIPEFSVEQMVSDTVTPMDTLAVQGGMDIGGGTLAPGCVLAQRFPRGNWVVFDEILHDDEGTGLARFTEEIKHRIQQYFPNYKAGRFWGDPAGRVRDSVYEQTAFDFMAAAGLMAMPAPSNDPRDRVNAIQQPCTRLIDGKPGLIIHRRCKMLIKGLQGGWQYKRIATGGSDDRYRSVPEKNKYATLCEALGYLLLGEGEGKAKQWRRSVLPEVIEHDFTVL